MSSSSDRPGHHRERDVRLFIYRHLVETATAPTVAETAHALGSDPPDVEAAYRSLAAARALVLRPDSTNIWMAMPFSNVATAFNVIVGGKAYYASCAWDAFGIPALLGADARIFTTCADCGGSIERKVVNGVLGDARGLVHFAVPARRWWDDVGHTSSTILLFAGEDHLDRWCARHNEPRGAVLTLEQTWALAKAWYSDRMTPEWRRRTPSETIELFASLGLTGEFWSV